MAFFVRPLTSVELLELEELCESYHSDPWIFKHLQIILLSRQRKKSGEIVHQLELAPVTVIKWIKRFNREGLDCFESMLSQSNESIIEPASQILNYRPVFVRALRPDEVEALQHLQLVYSNRPNTVKRFQAIKLSNQRVSVFEIALRLKFSIQTTRFWIKQFNKQGLDGLETFSDKMWLNEQLLSQANES